MNMPADIQVIYNRCVQLADEGWPYVYGGGHDPAFAPSIGLTKGPEKGYDCSGVLCCAVHAGNPQEMPEPLGTHELERFGLEGLGEWLAIRVVNGVVNGVFTEHCVLEFPKAPAERRFFMAGTTPEGRRLASSRRAISTRLRMWRGAKSPADPTTGHSERRPQCTTRRRSRPR